VKFESDIIIKEKGSELTACLKKVWIRIMKYGLEKGRGVECLV
jgi:hypothetical protein